MRLVKLTNPTTLAVNLSSVKDHLRIERDEPAYDEDLTELIRAAIELIEQETHVTLITTQFSASWDTFPGEVVKIPAWPVSSIESVQYLDANGTTQTATHREELTQCPATVRPPISDCWPDVQDGAINGFTANFTAGYGATADDQPYAVRHIIKLLVGHWFKHREAVGTAKTSEVVLAFHALKNILRVNEFEEFLSQ